MTATTGTYVFGLVAHAARPRVRRSLAPLPDGGPVRLIAARKGWWLAVSDVPLTTYGAEPLQARLQDLDWVSSVAVAHDGVLESFLACDAVLPFKLFTIFLTDERAIADATEREADLAPLVARLTRRDEWGVRVSMRRTRAAAAPAAARRMPASGTSYLRQKKALRDATVNGARHARAVAADLFDMLAGHAVDARRRPATDLAAGGGPLILDAAFLVPRTKTATLKATAARRARALEAEGFDVALTGPWPPYSFVQD